MMLFIMISQSNLFTTDTLPYTRAYFGQGTVPILMDNVRCTGNEERLIDCPFNNPSSVSDTHSEDAGVRCYTNNTGSMIIHDSSSYSIYLYAFTKCNLYIAANKVGKVKKFKI